MDLISFLNDSVTPFHTVENIAREFSQNGFEELFETDVWNLRRGASYFVKRGAALFAFRMPDVWNAESRFRLASAHTDFPALKISPNPDKISAGIHLLHPEVYGGALENTWFDRDLGIAGLVMTLDSGKLKKNLVKMKSLCRIPELAIHLNRGVKENGFSFNSQNHLNACFSASGKTFGQVLEEEVGSRVVDFELQFFDAQPAAFGGFSKEWIYSGRLDNLLSCHALVEGLRNASESSLHLCGAFFFDNEEIGSETRSGAAGNFAFAMLERIAECENGSRGELWGKLSDSFLFSLDVAHATHPAYEEKMEPNHAPVLGKGVVLKVNAKKRYASETVSNAFFKCLCEKAEIPMQTFVCRNDMPCGSTVGPHLSASLGIPTVDLGEAILSMHSIREMAAVENHGEICSLMKSFYQS